MKHSDREGAATILIIDDEEVIHASLKRVLTRKGYQAEAVFSAREGLERLRSRRYDLVITDLMMPEMNGIALLRALQQRESQVPVIMITGYPTINTAIQAMRLGARDYVSKPFTRKELLGPVLRALRRDLSEAAPAEPEGGGEDIELVPGVVVFLAHHSWARYRQDGTFQIGVERTFLGAVGELTQVAAPNVGALIEQGLVGLRLTNEEGEDHDVAMPLTGQITSVNEEALGDPGSLTADTWLARVLPSDLDSELKKLQPR